MYTPVHFRAEDRTRLAALVRRHSFATLVTYGEGGLFATHLPFLYEERGERGTLLTHLARANPQWRAFTAGQEAMVIFQGEHGYISPSWYVSGNPSVPTWNYEAVHVHSVPRILDDAAAAELLVRTVAAYERAGSRYVVPRESDFLEKNARAIVAIEIPITRWEGKFKLSQNRPPEDIAAVIVALEKQGDAESQRLAAAMREANGLAK